MDLFAGICVSDFEAARPWYEALLGSEPSFLPHDTEAVWERVDHGYVYIVEDPGRAGHSVLTFFLENLDGEVAAIAERGIEPTERETYSNGVRKITYRDADGNEIGLGGGRSE